MDDDTARAQKIVREQIACYRIAVLKEFKSNMRSDHRVACASPIHVRQLVASIERKARPELPMWFRTAFAATVGTIIASLSISVRAQDAPPANIHSEPRAAAIRGETLKERLGDKASDEQRVDNCKVPPDRRGTKVRPDGCEHEVSPPSIADPK
jgi:hypothetical protein